MALFAARSRNCLFLSRLLPRSSLGFQRTQERNVAVRSTQFPEYSLIFDFEKIKAVSRFNRTKMQMTFLTGVGCPLVMMVQQLGYITPSTAGSFAFAGCFLTLFLHSVGFLFNNTIGYIYLKDDGESVKISYVGYWGHRVNMDTKIDDIHPVNDLPTRFFDNPWYHRVCLTNSKKTYKMYLTVSQVLDKDVFTTIFGKIY